MTPKRRSTPSHAALRRTALWPWLVAPMIILALFVVLHNVRRSGGGSDQDTDFGPGIP